MVIDPEARLAPVRTDSQLVATVRAIIQEWLDKQGQDRCWYYPELFQQLARELELNPNLAPGLPPRAEFVAGCHRYQAAEYGCDN